MSGICNFTDIAATNIMHHTYKSLLSPVLGVVASVVVLVSLIVVLLSLEDIISTSLISSVTGLNPSFSNTEFPLFSKNCIFPPLLKKSQNKHIILKKFYIIPLPVLDKEPKNQKNQNNKKAPTYRPYSYIQSTHRCLSPSPIPIIT